MFGDRLKNGKNRRIRRDDLFFLEPWEYFKRLRTTALDAKQRVIYIFTYLCILQISDHSQGRAWQCEDAIHSLLICIQPKAPIYLEDTIFTVSGRHFTQSRWTTNQNYSNQIFHYTRCNTPERVTSSRAHLRVIVPV